MSNLVLDKMVAKLDVIKIKLLNKMEQKRYSTLKLEKLNLYCTENLKLFHDNKEMNTHGAYFLNLFYWNTELTDLFKTYCDTAQKINEQRTLEKYNQNFQDLKTLVNTKKLEKNLHESHIQMLKIMEELYPYIQEWSEKEPKSREYIIDVITLMKKMVDLQNFTTDNHSRYHIRNHIRSVPGNINYVFFPLILPMASVHMTVPIMVVGGLNPATALGIAGICILALTIALIVTSICLFLSSRRTGFSEKLVKLCDLYDHAKYQNIKGLVHLKVQNAHSDEKESLQEILDLIENQTHSNTTRFSMLRDLHSILNATTDKGITLAAFKALSPTWRITHPGISLKTCSFFNRSYEKRASEIRNDLQQHPADTHLSVSAGSC